MKAWEPTREFIDARTMAYDIAINTLRVCIHDRNLTVVEKGECEHVADHVEKEKYRFIHDCSGE